MATTEAPPTRRTIDLLDPEWYRSDPQDDYAWMRAHEPVYRDRRNGLWGITRHAALTDVERRSSVFASGLGYRAMWAPDETDMISLDDPRHGQQRALVQRELTRNAVTARADEVLSLVTELLDRFVADGEVEVVGALAAQLPARLTCRLLGLDDERWPEVKSWSERLMRLDMRDRDGGVFVDFIDANLELAGATVDALMGGGCPARSLIGIWSKAEIDGVPLPPETIVHEVGLFVAGGAETTRTLIGHGLRALCDHPEDWEAMAADPSLVPGAVEELLRWVTPLNNFFRRCMADTEVAGVPIARGDRVVLLYPSANRDEAVFDDPMRFDIRRSPNRHVAFGFGTHLCIGANLARLTVGTVLTELSKRVTDLRPVAEPDVEPNIFARAVRSFTLGFTPR